MKLVRNCKTQMRTQVGHKMFLLTPFHCHPKIRWKEKLVDVIFQLGHRNSSSPKKGRVKVKRKIHGTKRMFKNMILPLFDYIL